MVNTLELDNKIKLSGLKVGFIVETLGISRQSFNKKRTNQTPFRVSEVYVVSDLLRLTDCEKRDIFFADNVEI